MVGDAKPKRRRKARPASERGEPTHHQPQVDWSIPSPPLAIDKAVTTYLKPLLRKDFRGNPYEVARLQLALAIGWAAMENEKKDRLRWRDRLLKTAAQEAKKQARSLRAFCSLSWFEALTDRTVRGTARPVHEEQNDRFARINFANHALAAAERALVEIEKECAERVGRKESRSPTEDALMAVVVETLAFGWASLTGRAPDPTSREFQWFVARAIDTVCDGFVPPLVENVIGTKEAVHALRSRRTAALKRQKKPTEAWTFQQCRKALNEMKERPEWDRADRYLKDLHPPGTQFDTPAASADRRARRCGG